MTATVEQYQELVRALIKADQPCRSPLCGVTQLGHLLEKVPVELVSLVCDLDPECGA